MTILEDVLILTKKIAVSLLVFLMPLTVIAGWLLLIKVLFN